MSRFLREPVKSSRSEHEDIVHSGVYPALVSSLDGEDSDELTEPSPEPEAS